MHKDTIAAGVLGATGYVGEELVRLLGGHPRVDLVAATSEAAAGEVLRCGRSSVNLSRLDDAVLDGCDLVFSCLPHGQSASWVFRARGAGARAVDLSSDLRVAGAGQPAWASSSRYGQPELFRAELRGAELVANPGCYPTAALVALAPLLRRGLVSGAVVINAASGVTGAGRSPRRELLFGEVSEDFRPYAVGNSHRHVAELRAHASRLGPTMPELVFTPHLLPVRRGILETIYVPLAERMTEAAARSLWAEDYAGEPFVEVLAEGVPALSSAVGTNRVVIGVSAVAPGVAALLVVAAVDNLIKGAAGQAIQNMNLSFGWSETEGLPCRAA